MSRLERAAAACEVRLHLRSLKPKGFVSRDERTLQRGNDEWTVREVDAPRIPGAPTTSCLICESSDVVRRLWRYPQNWRSLTDDELWRLVESGGR